MRVPSRFPPGSHRIRVTWKDSSRHLERIFTFKVNNPNFGKPLVDAQSESMKTEFPNARVSVLWQGNVTDGKEYAGCRDAFISTRHLKNSGGSNNYGGKDHLWVGPYGGSHRTLIRYDLSMLPKERIVKRAVLRLHMYNSGRPGLVSMHRVLRPWGAGSGGADQEYKGGRHTNGQDWQHIARPPIEGECSWSMSARTATWAGPGCGKAGEDHEEASVSKARFNSKEAEGKSNRQPARYWINWDVTAAVQAWVQNPDQNFGLLLRLAGKAQTECRFHSAEYNDPVYRPRLVIAYE
ncbi:MAG: DNRLRE domain-containing protein [Planctomycetota bacterium]|nr:DNRLRE domain-containing protein [Planctomycetota bacterium]MDP7248667.1 DNRLRE domain-containing protein [Planctomycetota bacterium]